MYDGPMERRKDPRLPIRLKVTYKSAEALVTEYTTCVSKGGCAMVTEREVARGTKFVFEMYAHDHAYPLEVEGEVVRVQPIEGTRKFEIGIRYLTAGAQREVLDQLLSKIMVDMQYQAVRRHPRIPVNLVAYDRDPQIRYLIRDASRGGLRIEGRTVSSDVRIGTPAEIKIWIGEQGEPFLIRGTVVWLHRGTRATRTRFGVQFDSLDDTQQMVVDGLTRLLRPRRLELTLGTEHDHLVRSLTGADRSVKKLSAMELADSIRDIATGFLIEMPLSLAVETEVEDTASVHTDLVRVGIVGEIDGEILVETSLGLGARIASQTVGDEVPVTDRPLVADALTEWVTTLAGRVCDRLDEQGVEMEVTAPIPGLPRLRPEDSLSTLVLAGEHGRVVLSIITRDVLPSAWPT